MTSLAVEKIRARISNIFVELGEIEKFISKNECFNEQICVRLLEVQKMMLTITSLLMSLPADYEIQKLCKEKKEIYDKHKDYRE